MPKTRRRIAREEIFEQNKSAPVNCLTPEILAAILLLGKPRVLPNTLESRMTVGLEGITYNFGVSSVSKGWREVVWSTAAMWTCVVLPAPFSAPKSYSAIKLLDLFIRNSKGAKIDLVIQFGHIYPSLALSEKIVSKILSRMCTQLHRTRRLYIDCAWIPFSTIFPLPKTSTSLEELFIQSNCSIHQKTVPLFKRGSSHPIRTLLIRGRRYTGYYYASLQGVDPTSIQFLQVTSDIVDLTEYRQFLRQCINLQSFICSPRHHDWDLFGAGWESPLVLPHLTYLNVQADWPPRLATIEAHSLRHLVLKGGFLQYSDVQLDIADACVFPSLITLTLLRGILTPQDTAREVQRFLGAHPGLRALSVDERDEETISILLRAFDDAGDMLTTICPALTRLRFASYRREPYFDHGTPYLRDKILLLMSERPTLVVEWLPNESTIGRLEEVEAAFAEFRSRFSATLCETGKEPPLPFDAIDWDDIEDTLEP